jgi:SAM-dependent methyltransferase
MNLSDFILSDGVYCQKDFSTGEFENEYFSLREKEGRILSDDTVKKLPFISDPEWKIRALSAKKLVKQLKKENTRSFIEVGCGNGWLTNYLQRELNAKAVGIDVVKAELMQAARISEGKSTFFYGDIFSSSFDNLEADTIVLASSIQYFPDVDRLIRRLNGTIHIIDSPIYETGLGGNAKERSANYFHSKKADEMKTFYFHHEKSVFAKAEFLYRPNKLKTLLGHSPFPWIRIRKDP